MPLIMTPIEFAKANNPNWPLPPDYQSLGMEGQRLARVNAACLQNTPENAVAAWRFFCNYYLKADDEAGFDPLFYQRPLDQEGGEKKTFREHGPLHIQMIYSFERDDLSAWGCPRGSGKSTTARSYLVFKPVTNTQYEINLFKLKDDFVMEDLQRIREQLDSNQRILDDFGRQRSPRGDGIWNNHMLQTLNKCWVRGYGVDGGKRGPRANFNLCDDMEKDPKRSTMTDDKVGELKDMICRVLIPMMEDGARMSVIGTMVHAKSFLNHILSQDEADPNRDPRFSDKHWFKANVIAEDEKGHNAWPAKFTKKFLAKKRATMGEAAYASEYDGQPLSSQRLIFKVHPEKHDYVVDGEVDLTEPFTTCSAWVLWNEVEGIKEQTLSARRVGWNEWLLSLYRFITVDYAYSEEGSDWSIIHVIGQDGRGDWFSLDMYKMKGKFIDVAKMAWEMALRWRVQVVGAEAYPIQETFVEIIETQGEIVRQRHDWCAAFFPITPPPSMSKGQKILRLAHRMELGKWKMPGHRRQQNGYRELYHQFAFFTEDLGNLKNDDEIDTVSLAYDMIRSRNLANPKSHRPETTIERLLAGETYIPGTSIPLVLALPSCKLDDPTLARISSQQRRQRLKEAEAVASQTESFEGLADEFEEVM